MWVGGAPVASAVVVGEVHADLEEEVAAEDEVEEGLDADAAVLVLGAVGGRRCEGGSVCGRLGTGGVGEVGQPTRLLEAAEGGRGEDALALVVAERLEGRRADLRPGAGAGEAGDPTVRTGAGAEFHAAPGGWLRAWQRLW